MEGRPHFRSIRDRRIREKLIARIDQLAESPDLQGKPLRGDLRGLRSVRAVGQRFRIVYRLRRRQIEVLVVALGRRREGHRKDIYTRAERRAESDPEND